MQNLWSEWTNGLDCTKHGLHQLLGLESDSEPGWEHWQFMLQSSCFLFPPQAPGTLQNRLRFAKVRILVCIFMCVCVFVCILPP